MPIVPNSKTLHAFNAQQDFTLTLRKNVLSRTHYANFSTLIMETVLNASLDTKSRMEAVS